MANVFRSSIGKKFIMAVTGMALFLFVVLHLLGNLQVFLGPETLNRYGAFLQGNLELLWPARIGLLVLVVLHIWAAVTLTAENRAARPQPYAQQELVAASYASRTMLMSGLIIAAFIVYHPAALHGAGQSGQSHRQGFHRVARCQAAARRVRHDGDRISQSGGGGVLCVGDVPCFSCT